MIRYSISDRRMFAGEERTRQCALLAHAPTLAAQGVSFLQLREKDLPPADLLALAHQLRALLPRGTTPRLLLNAPAELALAARADGLHLPGTWTPADLARAHTLFRDAGLPPPLLSVTAHTLADIHRATTAPTPPDLLLFGPIFEKVVHGTPVLPGIGLPALAEACRHATPIPVLALGGITLGNTPSCLAAGAAGIAAIRLFLPATPAQK